MNKTLRDILRSTLTSEENLTPAEADRFVAKTEENFGEQFTDETVFSNVCGESLEMDLDYIEGVIR